MYSVDHMTDMIEPKLKRTLNLPLLVFYGLGTTIGALVLLKWRDEPASPEAFTVPNWVPIVGLIFGIVIFAISLVA